MEASPRPHRRADDEELDSALGGDARDVLGEAARPRAHDLPPHADAVGAGHGRRRLEPLPQVGEPPVHVRVQRQLALDDERSDEHDAGAPVGGEAAREIECVLRLRLLEQRHGDAAIGDRARPAREVPGPVVQEAYVRELHRSSWYGTEARITCGSTSRRRFT